MAGVLTDPHTFVPSAAEQNELCCLCGGHKRALYHTHESTEKWDALLKLQHRADEAGRRLASIRLALKHAGHNACTCDKLTGFQCLLHGILDDGVQLRPARPRTSAKVSHRRERGVDTAAGVGDPWRDEGGG